MIKVIEKQKNEKLESLKRQEKDNKLLLQRLSSIFRSVVVSEDAASRPETEKEKSF